VDNNPKCDFCGNESDFTQTSQWGEVASCYECDDKYTKENCPFIWRNQMIQKIICPECKGEGEVEYDHWSLRSFQKDVGEFVSKIEICATCEGSGQVDEIEDDGFITVYNSDWIKK
jgi:DnaJ-class molecular chaperone